MVSSFRGWVFAVVVLTAAGLIACQWRSATKGPPNIVLITIDTLRADHCSMYGYQRPTTPEMDKWFAPGLIFDRAYSTTSKTASSTFSILTGMMPQDHGVRMQFQLLHPQLVTVAPLLAEKGYQTAGIVSTTILTREATGLDQQFEYYDDYVNERELNRNFYERNAQNTNTAVLKWLNAFYDEERPFFLWVHYMDPHGPYTPPDDKPVTFTHDEPKYVELKKIPGYVRIDDSTNALMYCDLYDEEIAYMDMHIGKLLGYMDEHGLLDNTYICMTADHGETLTEHESWFAHGYQVYEELIHVPLAIRGPGIAPGRVATPVTLTSVAPTILRWAGLEPREGMDTIALGPEMPMRLIFAESDYGGKGATQWRCVIDGDQKFKVALKPTAGRELTHRRYYDLSDDPGERRPAKFPTDETVLQPLEALLAMIEADVDLGVELPTRYVMRGTQIRGPKEAPELPPDLDAKALDALRALGYLQ